MSAPRSTRSILAALLLAVIGAWVPVSMPAPGGAGGAVRFAGGGCCCVGVVTTDACCCASDGACADTPSRGGPVLVRGCCGGEERTPLATAWSVCVLVVPSEGVRLRPPRVRAWAPADARRPDDVRAELPSPVPRDARAA